MKLLTCTWILLIVLCSGLPAQSDPARTNGSQSESVESSIQGFLQTPQVLNLDSVRTIIGYPEEARLALIQGKVVVRVLVGPNGEFKRAKLFQGVHPILDDAVLSNLSACRFSPAIMDNGKPCAFWVNIPFYFRLVDE